MEMTKTALEYLIDPVSKKIAGIVSKDIAVMVSDALKNEILEAQKYRIDKEFELKIREQNSKHKDYCLKCDTFKHQVGSNLVCKCPNPTLTNRGKTSTISQGTGEI